MDLGTLISLIANFVDFWYVGPENLKTFDSIFCCELDTNFGRLVVESRRLELTN